MPCEAGSYCPYNGTITASPCPQGYYCPGTNSSAPLPTMPCPAGTYGTKKGFASVSQCSQCDPGKACTSEGLSAPSQTCYSGYMCLVGSPSPNPQELVVTATATYGPCPAGYYCNPYGYNGGCDLSSLRAPCPVGTFNPNTGAADSSACQPCTPGSFCAITGLSAPNGTCTAGYYCAGSSASATDAPCPAGSACIAGSASHTPCAPGTFTAAMRASSCANCPAGSACPSYGMSVPLQCPAGFFCRGSNVAGTESPCPSGTFSNTTGLVNATQCTPCTPGSWCGSPGLTAPTGLCGPGYFCSGGASSPQPNDGGLTGDKCAAGFVCGSGAVAAVPQLRVTGLQCPIGSFCVAGAVAPQPCVNGTYQPLAGQSSCLPCPAGQWCAG